jgi:NADPH:quinone reductase
MSKMKAWQVHEVGDYHDVLRWEETERPRPEGPSSLIRVKAAALNFPDILFIAGKYQMRPPLPFTPGIEAVGEVVETGSDSRFSAGDRVIATGMGAYGEYMLAMDPMTFLAPDGMNDIDAAAIRIVYQTAYMALTRRADLQPDETLLVNGGAGGVGTAAIQVGKALGARVIATAGSEQHLEVCRDDGADHVLNYHEVHVAEQVKELTEGRGADVVFDPVGGDAFDESTHCVAFEGRVIVIGFASGRIPEIATNRVLNKNIDVIGFYWTNYQIFYPGVVDTHQEEIDALYREGKIKPVVSHVGKLSELPQALDLIESHKGYGKIVLEAE